MIHYIKKYPFSFAFILLVIYLSFFKPPSLPEIGKIPHLDKVVHAGMYFVMSFLLWWEFLRSHKKGDKIWYAWVGAFLCPVLFGGAVELLQTYLTAYRGGDWMDFLANTTGATSASLLAYYLLRPRIWEQAEGDSTLTRTNKSTPNNL